MDSGCEQPGMKAKMAEARQDININEPDKNSLLSWLKEASLENFYQTFVNNGLTEVSHIQDVQEEDALSFGLSKFQSRRLLRCFTEYKAQQENARKSSLVSKTTLKTSSSSVVIALPKAMRNFVETRDGNGHTVVNTESLKRTFRNLYYQSPVTPNQIFSNSFILKMATERLTYSKSLRDCENWCRKERWTRIKLLMGVTKPPTMNSWTPHHTKQSVYGCIEIAKNCYPEIVALKENDINNPGKTYHEHVCKFLEMCQEALSLANENLTICTNEIERTMKESTNGKTVKEGQYQVGVV